MEKLIERNSWRKSDRKGYFMLTEKQLCELIYQSIYRGDSMVTRDIPEMIVIDTPLLDSGYLDSLIITSLVNAIEKETGLEIPQSRLTASTFRTPRSLLNVLIEISKTTMTA
jgi:acyl carrier protein